MSSEQKVQPPKGVLRKNSKYNENFTPTKKNDNTYGTPQKQGDFLSLDGDLICQPSDPSSSKNIFIGTEGQTPKKLLEFDRFEPPSSLRQNILPTVSEDDDRDEDSRPDSGGQYDENDNDLNDGVPERVLDLLRKQREKFSPDSTHIRTSYSNNNNNENNNSSRSSRASPLELFSAPVPERPKTSRARPCPSPDDFYDYVVPSPEPKANNAISKMLILQNKSKNKKKTRNKSSNNRDSVRSSIESNGSNGTTGSDTSGSAEFKIHAWDGVNSSDDDNDYDNDSNSNYTGGGDSVAGSLFNGVNNSGGEMNDKTVFNRARVGPDLSKEESDKVRMLGCWLFGTALRL